jgi:hypothetical protein
MARADFPYFISNTEMNRLRPHLNSIEIDPLKSVARMQKLDESLRLK